MDKSKTNRCLRLIGTLGLTLLFSSIPAPAQSVAQSKPDDDATTRPATEDKLSVTDHTLTLGGSQINYKATAGTIAMKDEAGKPKANFFFVAYVKQPPGDPATRPITFVFNGGPGAAAVWLHLGAIGPKRVDLGETGIPGAPPYRLIDNDQSWLDLTDLVFIDPVGTGFSRPAEGNKPEDFFGVQNDIKSVAEFIRIYLTRYDRWSSPKFIAGESYGTTRAAGLAEYLESNEGIAVNGIILISSVLNFQTLNDNGGNDLPYALYLPTYTAIAVYHGKIHTNNEKKLLDEVGQWAENDYLAILAKGSALSDSERSDAIDKLAKYTSLPKDLIDRCNLRIDPGLFRKKLLEDQKLVIGRFDGRVTGEDTDPEGDDTGFDPSLSYYLPVYTSTFNDYVRRELKFDSDLKYGALSPVGPWDFTAGQEGGMGYLDVSSNLRDAMVENPHLHVMVVAGYDDLATPFLAANYTFNHLDGTGRLTPRITQTYYDSGHMVYHNPDALKQLKKDVGGFMGSAE
jgi:carboxypeptidase C (cathepsin A)